MGGFWTPELTQEVRASDSAGWLGFHPTLVAPVGPGPLSTDGLVFWWVNYSFVLGIIPFCIVLDDVHNRIFRYGPSIPWIEKLVFIDIFHSYVGYQIVPKGYWVPIIEWKEYQKNCQNINRIDENIEYQSIENIWAISDIWTNYRIYPRIYRIYRGIYQMKYRRFFWKLF